MLKNESTMMKISHIREQLQIGILSVTKKNRQL